jgi:two-component system chemotaxis response regulator CheY
MIGANGDGGATMTLPAVLDLAAAESFHATLLQQAQGGALLRLDASGVETLTLPCIQVILAASRNYDVTIEAPSEGFVSAFKDLALIWPGDCGQDPVAVQDLPQVQYLPADEAPGLVREAVQEPVQEPGQEPAIESVQEAVEETVQETLQETAPDHVPLAPEPSNGLGACTDASSNASPTASQDECPQDEINEASMTKRILTIDDSRTIRDMLMLTLTDAGFEVLQGVDGQDGIDVLGDQQVDVIITDINMPKMDGYEVIRHLRASPAHKAIPILVLTTESDKDKKNLARDAGATGWMVKPFDPERLIATIRKVSP